MERCLPLFLRKRKMSTVDGGGGGGGNTAEKWSIGGKRESIRSGSEDGRRKIKECVGIKKNK